MMLGVGRWNRAGDRKGKGAEEKDGPAPEMEEAERGIRKKGRKIGLRRRYLAEVCDGRRRSCVSA